MSVQAITWSLGKAPSLASQAVLFSLANYADEWGITFVGQERLADDCACRKATITSNMTKLEEAGLIARVRRHDTRGRRTSDVVVLAPLAADRAPMADADKRAESVYSPEVCALARLGAPSVSSPPSLDTLDDRLGAPDEHLSTLGVPEPSEEPSERTGLTPPPSARAEFSDELAADAQALLRAKRKVDGAVVTEAEMAVATAALTEFNAQAGSDFGLGANLTCIVMRARERPSWDPAKHRRLVQSAFRLRWWERSRRGGRPTPQVIYGNAKVFEQVVQDAADEAAGREVKAPHGGGQRVYSPDGRTWGELTSGEQIAAREAMSMGQDPAQPRVSEPIPAATRMLTAANFMDEP